jgi:nucleotide-binding universal stress UspA family protein
MIKSILVPATGDQADLATFAAALGVAREFSAHIEFLHVHLDAVATAVAMTSDAAGGVLLEGIIEQLERDAREREAKAKRMFDEFCARESLAILEIPEDQARGKPTAQWHVETGDEARSIEAYGMAADLIVAARGADDEVTARLVLEAALLDTGRPLLIPGAAVPAPAFGGTVAIAWKATPQAARAVAAAMPFIARAERVIVMTVEEGQASDGADRLVRNLAWHGCRATAEILTRKGEDAVETLLAAAKERTGLLVMGGYGHSRLREWIFGGFTQRVLADAPLPVLMAH